MSYNTDFQCEVNRLIVDIFREVTDNLPEMARGRPKGKGIPARVLARVFLKGLFMSEVEGQCQVDPQYSRGWSAIDGGGFIVGMRNGEKSFEDILKEEGNWKEEE